VILIKFPCGYSARNPHLLAFFNALKSALTSLVEARNAEVKAGLGLMAITNEPFDSQACGIDYVISHRYGDGAII
jgi:hypothetical protein